MQSQNSDQQPSEEDFSAITEYIEANRDQVAREVAAGEASASTTRVFLWLSGRGTTSGYAISSSLDLQDDQDTRKLLTRTSSAGSTDANDNAGNSTRDSGRSSANITSTGSRSGSANADAGASTTATGNDLRETKPPCKPHNKVDCDICPKKGGMFSEA
jgi:hypothetical protein